MQSVHATLLPNGKILIVNGSSMRLRPEGSKFKPINVRDPKVTDNTAIVDPGTFHQVPLATPQQKVESEPESTNEPFSVPPEAAEELGLPLLDKPTPESQPAASAKTNIPKMRFRKIASPENPLREKDNDLFCSGHLQTPNGDVLFVSGTQKYIDLNGGWKGTTVANLFRWESEEWEWAGDLEDGHWYPTLLPLPDGQIAAISGWSKKLSLIGRGIMSTWMEFYDWKLPPDRAWTRVNIKHHRNGPFKDGDKLDHYPRILELNDGRYLITGDGSGGGKPSGKRSYFMTITPSGKEGKAPIVTFEHAADRAGPRRMYSSAVVDPNSAEGDVLLIGGQLASEKAVIGPSENPKNPENAVTAQAERFTPNPKGKGRWELIPDFMGDRPTDGRSNHYATLLPTRDLLIMGGSMYRFYRPNFQPLLLSPDESAPGGYSRKWMNPGTQPRVYHSNRLLLPDGRIFVAGGNSAFAARTIIKDEQTQEEKIVLRLDTYFKDQWVWRYGSWHRLPAFLDQGWSAWPAEVWQVEFFYPPYLFIKGHRPMITDFPKVIHYGSSHELSVSHMTKNAMVVLIKLGSATHGFDMGQRRLELTHTQDTEAGKVTFTAPSDTHLSPPAYYMIFYVNNVGHPSVAKIVRLTPEASTSG